MCAPRDACLTAASRRDLSEIGVIENVESFDPELQFHVLVNRKLATYSQIHLPGSKSSRKVARSITESRTDRSKGVWIDRTASRTALPLLKIPQPLKSTRAIGTVQIHGLARNQV